MAGDHSTQTCDLPPSPSLLNESLRDRRLHGCSIAPPGKAIGDEFPDAYQDNRADQRPNERDVEHNNVPNAGDDDDIRHQPDADQRGNDGSYKAEGEMVPHQTFCDQAYDGGNDEVNDKV